MGMWICRYVDMWICGWGYVWCLELRYASLAISPWSLLLSCFLALHNSIILIITRTSFNIYNIYNIYNIINIIRYEHDEIAAAVIAPCTHDGRCPLEKGAWCSFSQKVHSGMIRIGSEEKFSYVTCRDGDVNGWKLGWGLWVMVGLTIYGYS